MFAALTAGDSSAPSATPARVKKNMSKTIRASVGRLSASFVAKNKGWGPTIRIVGFGKSSATVSSHVLSGGGSARNSHSRIFVLRSNGGTVAMVRTKPAKGLGRVGGGRSLRKQYARALRPLAPGTALGQAGAYPRQMLLKLAPQLLTAELASRLPIVANGGTAAHEPTDS